MQRCYKRLKKEAQASEVQNACVTVALEKLLSIPELSLAWLLSAETAPLSSDTWDVSSVEDRDESPRFSAPVADSFRPNAALVDLSYHPHGFVLCPQSLQAWLGILLSFSSRCWRIISSTLHGVEGMPVSPWWTKQHRSSYHLTTVTWTGVSGTNLTVIQGFSSSWEGDMR